MPAPSNPPLATRAGTRLAVLAATCLAGIAWMRVVGPLPLVTWTTVHPESVPALYTFLAFPALGLGLADLVDLLRVRRIGPLALTALELVTVVALGNARLGLLVPVSGHATLFAWLLVRRILAGGGWRRAEAALAATLLTGVAIVKLVTWHDPGTLLTGTFLGALLALPSWLLARRGP